MSFSQLPDVHAGNPPAVLRGLGQGCRDVCPGRPAQNGK